MGRPPSVVSFLVFLFWLGASWEAQVSHPISFPSNATVFSHVYTIKLAGDMTEGEGASTLPQEALGPPGSSRGGGLYEHTLEGPDQEHVVFTHRINLPPQSCGCPPGTEDTRELLKRLQALENEVRMLKDTCQAGSGCCPANARSQASTGQTDVRTLCSHHGSFDLSRCQCECEPGWSGPICAEPNCPGGCGGPERGTCVNGRCQCRPGYWGTRCEEPPSCPDDCNDQGRCVDGRCSCFPGYVGPSCSEEACPQDCQGHGRCVSGLCVCDPGYSGPDCGTRACPSNCNRRGECINGRCVCEPGFTGPACGTKSCPNDCTQRGRCLKGGVCACYKGYTGPDCGQLACPEDCSGHGECQNGVCLCHDGYSGDDCSIEIPSIGVRVSNRDETSFRLEWNRPEVLVDAYEIHVIPRKDRWGGESVRLSGSETIFERRGLTPGEEYTVTIRAEKGQRYGPPVSQTVQTRVAPPRGLRSSQVTENTVTLQWEPPASHPEGYILSYVPVTAPRPAQATKRVELPAKPERVTLEDLESNTRYRITLVARQSGESSRATTIITSTTAPASPTAAKTQPILSTTRSPEVSLKDLTVTDASPNSLQVTWSAPPSSFRGFSLQYRDPKSNATPGEIRVPGTERSITVTGLSPRTDYELQLYGEKPSGLYEGPIMTKASTAPPAEAEKPSLGEISVLEVTDNAARLSWSVATGTFDSFLIQYKDGEGKPKSLPVNGDLREAIISDLVPSRKYKFNLYGLVGRKRHGPISTETVTAKPDKRLTAPPGLGELSASDITSDSVRLSWSVPSGNFDSFVIQYKDAEGRPQVLPTEGDAREVTIPSLAPSRRYRFNLYGISNRKRLGPATTDVTTVPREEEPTPEPVLSDLYVSDTTSDSVRLTWSVPMGNFDSFLLQYQDSEGNDQSLPVNQDSRETTVSNLVPSQRYRFNLYGISGSQQLGPISADAVTAPLPTTPPPPPPPQPTLGDLSVSDVTSNSVRLSWTVPTGSFDSFVIQYKDAEGKPQSLPVEGDSHEIIVPNLASSRRYKFNLYGIFGRKRVGPISADTVTASPPQEPQVPPSLGELSASDITSDSVRLSWTVPTGSFDTFQVQYKDAEGKPQAIPVEGVFREIIVPNLVPSRRYKFNLYGLTGRKRLGPISTDIVTVPLPAETRAPPSLGQLSVSNVTSDSAHLTWTVRTGNFDSFLIQYKDAEGKPQALPLDRSTRETTITGLSPSRRYKFNLFGMVGRKRLGPASADTVTASTVKKEESAQPSLGELSVSDVTSSSALLSWTVPTGSFDSFLIQYKDAEGKPQSLPVEGASREITVSNLAPSRRYKFNLFGVSGRKRLGPVSSEATTAKPEEEEKEEEEVEKGERPKPRLGELLVSETHSDSVHLSWSVPVGSFDSFLVQYEDGDDDVQSLPVDGDAREVIVPNLVPSQRYQFDLYGLSGGETLGPISTDTFTVPLAQEQQMKETATPAPEPNLGELSVSNVTSDSVRLSWDVPRGTFDSFMVQYTDAENNPQEIPVDKETNSIVIYYLVPFYRYTFYLYGISERRRLGPVSISIVTATRRDKKHQAEEADEEVPTGMEPRLGMLTVSEVTNSAARLTWTVPQGTFDSFSIQYKDAEGRPQAIPVEGGYREVIVPNLVPSHKYRFNLYGISGQGRLGPISVSAVTTAPTTKHGEKLQEVREETDKEVPTGTEPRLGEFAVSEVTSNTARLTWTVPQGTFDSFSIQYKDAEGRPQNLPVGGDSREVMVPNLIPSHKYRFNLYGISGQRRLGPISAGAVTTATIGDEKHQEVGEEAVEEVPSGIEPRLGELEVSEVTNNTARLTWTVPQGTFDSFSIQYKDAEGRPQALPVGGGSREAVVPNLVPSHKYRFNLYGISGQGRLGPISASAVTTAAETPRQATEEEEVKELEEPSTSIKPSLGDLTVSEVTPDSLLLSWSIREGSFDSFLIQYKDAAGKFQMLPVDGAMRSLHLYNLTPSQRYKFNVFGVSDQKRLGPVSIDAVTAAREPSQEETTVQPRLGDLSVSKVTIDSVSLSWSVPTGNFDSFLVQYKDTEGKPQVLPLNGDSREVTVPGLAPSRRYKFNLYGISGHKRVGPISTDAVTGPSAKPESTAPLKLGELSAQDITAESLLLSWTVKTGNFDSFIIQYRDADGKPHALPVDGSLHTMKLHDLVPSHRYRFNLYGVSGRKRFGPVSIEAVTAASERAPPPRPSLGELSASDINSTSVRLSWNVLTGNFDSFIVQYRDAEGKPQALPVDKNFHELVISNLVPSRRYKFNLYGLSGRKRLGPISTEAVTERMEEPEIHPTLGDLFISEVTKDSVRLSWTIPAGRFNSFLIQYKDAEGRPKTVPIDADARTVVISDLMASHRYKFNLYGIVGRKRLGPISTDAVTAFPDAPTRSATSLENLVVSEVTPTSLQLTWEVPEGEFDSFLVRCKESLMGSGRSPPPAKEVTVAGDKRSAVLLSLTPNTEYSLTVYGIREGSQVANINTVARTSGIELDSPRDLRFSDIRETSVVADWRAPSSHIDRYKVSFQPSDGGEPTSISVDGSKLRTTIEGLTPGASYEVTVVSIRGFEESEPLVGYVTTVPDGPSDLRAINVTDSSAVLTWHPAMAEMNNYIVTYGPIGGPRVSESVPGNRVQLRLSGLRRDAEYRASVYGEREGNRSSPVSATFTTGTDGPRDLRASEISARSARLTWSPPHATPGGYLLSYETPYGQLKEISMDANVTSYELQDLIPSTRYQVQVQALRRGMPTAPTSTSFTTEHLTYPFPRDCSEESLNGPGPSRVTTIYLGGNRERPLQVYCDMETDGGGWIVFQRRMNGETDFWRDWQDYATGFGNLTREFWLGNDALHQLTSSGDYELRVDLRAGSESVYATYQSFRVDPPADYYRLHLGSYSGTAGDSFSYHSGSVFSTRDRDPNRVIIPCAVSYRGAWWYRNCHYANLNGLYANNRDHQGINWFNWKGFEFSIPFTEMKLRPRGFQPLRRA